MKQKLYEITYKEVSVIRYDIRATNEDEARTQADILSVSDRKPNGRIRIRTEHIETEEV